MTLDDFVNNVKAAQQAAELTQEYAKDLAVAGQVGNYLGDRAGAFFSQTGLDRRLSIANAVNLAANTRDEEVKNQYKAEKVVLVKELDDKKLEERAILVEPAKTGQKNHDKYLDAHKKAYELQQILSDPEKYAGKVQKFSEEFVKSEIKDAQEEAKKYAENTIGKQNYISKKKVKEWGELMASIDGEEARNRAIELVKQDPLAAVRLYAQKAANEFYESFDAKDRTKKIAEYTRENILRAKDDKGIGYIASLAA